MITVAGALIGLLGIIVGYEASDRLFAGALTVGDFGLLLSYYGQIVGSSMPRITSAPRSSRCAIKRSSYT